MADKRNTRNYGSGRRLTDYVTRRALAEKARQANGRGDGFAEQACSALLSLSLNLEADGIRYLEKTTSEDVRKWADGMAWKLEAGAISRSATSSYASALNQVFKVVGRTDLRISASSCGLGRRQKYSNKNLATSAETRKAFKQWLLEKASVAATSEERLKLEALSISVDLQFAAGLRIRESCLLKPVEKTVRNNCLEIGKTDGTKNGRGRISHIYDEEPLRSAIKLILNNPDTFRKGSLTPSSYSWNQQRRWVKKVISEFRRDTGFLINFHGARHDYAHRRYADRWEEQTGIRIECPVIERKYGRDHIACIAARIGLTKEKVKTIDDRIREEVAKDLGHGGNRQDIGWSYLGR